MISIELLLFFTHNKLLHQQGLFMVIWHGPITLRQAVMLFTLIPAFSLILGYVVSLFSKPGPRFNSFAQHFAAGLIFAAVALELLPNIRHAHGLWPMVVGFSLGVILMMGIKLFTEEVRIINTSFNSFPFTLCTSVVIDLFIDGVLIGIGFTLGQSGGALITLALAGEIFFLALAVGTSMQKLEIDKSAIAFLSFILALFIGSWLGISVIAILPYYLLYGVLSFGVAALLYLVIEELLQEAHETKDTPYITAAFFLGFLIIYVMEKLL